MESLENKSAEFVTVKVDQSSGETRYLASVRNYTSKNNDCYSCNDEGCKTCLGGGGPGPQ